MVFVVDNLAAPLPDGERRTTKIRGPGCLLTQLADSRPMVRRWGVRDLAGYPQAATVLLNHLPRETDDGVREVILATLGAMGGETVLHGLLALLGSDDANLRNGAMEVLRLLATQTLPHLPPLLDHPNPELRLAAVELLHAVPPPDGRPGLLQRLAQEKNPRLVARLVIALGEHGLAEDLPLLAAVPDHFPGNPFLGFAVAAASRQLAPSPQPPAEQGPLSDDQWSSFKALLQATTGRLLADDQRRDTEEVLLLLAEAHGCPTLRDFFHQLRRPEGQPLWTTLLERLHPLADTFFHDSAQLRCLAGPVLEEILRARPRSGKVRLWCHAATASEPYSVAIALAEYHPHFADTRISLVASLETPQALAAARQGLFTEQQLETLPGPLQDRYFTAGEQGLEVQDSLRDTLHLHTLDLEDNVTGKRFREFDLILCRDLLSRRDPLARRRAAILFLDALNPGGYLILGAGETMSSISGLFRVRNLQGTLVFQKPFT